MASEFRDPPVLCVLRLSALTASVPPRRPPDQAQPPASRGEDLGSDRKPSIKLPGPEPTLTKCRGSPQPPGSQCESRFGPALTAGWWGPGLALLGPPVCLWGGGACCHLVHQVKVLTHSSWICPLRGLWSSPGGTVSDEGGLHGPLWGTACVPYCGHKSTGLCPQLRDTD